MQPALWKPASPPTTAQMFPPPRPPETSSVSAFINGIAIEEPFWRIKIQSNETVDFEKKMKPLEKDYHKVMKV